MSSLIADGTLKMVLTKESLPPYLAKIKLQLSQYHSLQVMLAIDGLEARHGAGAALSESRV
jgi:hypothetical protein